jgi:hypothetical protein
MNSKNIEKLNSTTVTMDLFESEMKKKATTRDFTTMKNAMNLLVKKEIFDNKVNAMNKDFNELCTRVDEEYITFK